MCPVRWTKSTQAKRPLNQLQSIRIVVAWFCLILVLRADTGGRSYVELVKNKPQEREGVRVYKQKVRGSDGKMYWKVARDTAKPITMAGFLRRANNITQEEVLGSRHGSTKRFREFDQRHAWLKRLRCLLKKR